MDIRTKFDIGQIVFIRTDPEQVQYMITEMWIKPNKLIQYYISYNVSNYWVYEFEITAERDILKTMT